MFVALNKKVPFVLGFKSLFSKKATVKLEVHVAKQRIPELEKQLNNLDDVIQKGVEEQKAIMAANIRKAMHDGEVAVSQYKAEKEMLRAALTHELEKCKVTTHYYGEQSK